MQNIECLAKTAENAWPGAVERIGDEGFTLDAGGFKLLFCIRGGSGETGLCRAEIGNLDDLADPGAFAEAALEGNFFWNGTDGAALSYRAKDGKAYLTGVFPADALEDDPQAFSSFADGMARTAQDWRLRFSNFAKSGKEAR